MKKLLIFLLIILCSLQAKAQDIIFRSSTDSIVAQVIVVDDDEITYLKWSNLQGPFYTIKTSEVAAIRYANGSYDFFKSSGNTAKTSKKSQPTTLLWRDGDTYYYGKSVMDRTGMLNWLQKQNCEIAYNQFREGYNMAQVGWSSLGVGVTLDIVGSILLWRYFSNSESSEGYKIAGLTIGIMGAFAEIACIPILCVGYTKMHSAVDTYNITCKESASARPYWAIQASNDGLGVALHF